MTVFDDIKDELDNAEWAGSIMLARAVALELCRQGEAAVAMLAALKELLQEAEKMGWADASYIDNASAAIAQAEAAGIKAG